MSGATRDPAAINVTPLIDVLLVLLIIFLVMMPVMMRMQTVAVPRSVSEEPERPPIVLALHADLTISIDDAPPILGVQLAAQLAPRLGPDSAVFLDPDDGVPWAEVIGTVDTVRALSGVEVAVRIRPELEATSQPAR